MRLKKIILTKVIILALVIAGIFAYRAIYYKKPVTYTSPKNTFQTKPTKHKIIKQPSPSTSNTNNSSSLSNSSNVNTNPSLYVTSSSGQITVHTPYNNETISSGFPINGTAKVNTVNYILIDNQVGQIAQGSLKVVNGKFQGTLNFTPHATSGVLQIYSPNPSNGAEENVINIDINY